jgi:hypothetical protein
MERPWLVRVIDIFYQLNEIFDLPQPGAVRTLSTLKTPSKNRRVGNGESGLCSL